ncbi:Putative ribonuclease H protein, partial [Glycine soja]
PPSKFKLNCHAAVDMNGNAGTGGVLRDNNGNVVVTFVFKIGRCSVTQAELWAIVLGIQVAKSRGFSESLVESDSKLAISLIQHRCSPSHVCFQLVEMIRKFESDGGRFTWIPAYPEANQVAEILSKFGLSSDTHSRIFPLCPSFVFSAVMAD